MPDAVSLVVPSCTWNVVVDDWMFASQVYLALMETWQARQSCLPSRLRSATTVKTEAKICRCCSICRVGLSQ